MSIRKRPVYKILLLFVLTISIALLLYLTMNVVTLPKWLMIDDYVEYWAAGRLNLLGGNPYNPEELLPLQQQAGRYFGVPVLMYNPPWMLLIAMPFGAISYSLGRSIWLFLILVMVIFSADITWDLYGGSKDKRILSWFIGLSFIPILDGLRTGQTGVFLLLGVAGFLYFHRAGKPWLAGASLAFLAVKPHILFLFLIGVLFWAIHNRHWVVLISPILTLLVASLIVIAINPPVFQQYLYAISHYPPEDWATPTLGNVLRMIFGIEYFWLQFVPFTLGIIWLYFYWKKHRSSWNWISQAPILLLVSIVTAAYGWTSDMAVFLIALISIATPIIGKSLNKNQWIVIVGYLIINFADLAMRVNQVWLWWLAPSLLIWYLISVHLISPRSETTVHSS